MNKGNEEVNALALNNKNAKANLVVIQQVARTKDKGLPYSPICYKLIYIYI